MVILGDRVVSVNGEFIAGKSYAEVVQLIQSTKDHLQLSVVPQQDDILQMVSWEKRVKGLRSIILYMII